MRKIRPLRRSLALALVFATLAPLALAETGIADFSNGAQGYDPYAAYGNYASNFNFDADLQVGYVALPGASMNPFYCTDRDLVSLNQLVYESVIELDANFEPKPLLADNWKTEGKTWTFQLRSGVVFHNGAPLTATDVVISYQNFLNAGKQNPYYGRLSLIEGMTALDDTTLEVKAKYSGYMTLYAMTFPVVQYGTVNDDLPRGTGPFWYTDYITDVGVRFEMNPLWWKKDAQLSSVVAICYGDSGDAIEALQTNQIDVLCSQSSKAALSKKLSDLTHMDYLTNIYEMLVPNLKSNSVMSDLRMRQAVMYAIDHAAIASNAYLGMAIQCEVPVNPSSWLYESQSAIFYYSPERALQLILDCGWKDLTGDGMLNKLNGVVLEDLTIRIVTYNEDTSAVRENAANLIAGYLAKVGVKTKIRVLDKEDVLEEIEDGNYDLALVGVNLSDVPNLTELLYSKGKLNLNNYRNIDMDNLITATGTTTTPEGLKSVFSEIQLSVVENLPVMGLVFRTGTVLSSRSLAGLSGISAGNTLNGIEFMLKE